MLRLQSITMRNFLSIGAIPQTVSLSSVPLTLILGLNGAGKTTMLQAISYALFDEPLTKIKKDNLVNSINNKQMELSIDFICNGISYRIERGRKPLYMRFLVDGVDHAQGTNDRTQVEIERVIGMSHTMFQHIIALNTFTTPFLKMKASDQRDLIEELMGISSLSELAAQLKLVSDKHKELLRDEDARIKANEQANQRIEDAIKDARRQAETWEQQHDRLLINLTTRLTEMDQIDVAAELLIFDQMDAWTAETTACQEQIRLYATMIETTETNLRRLKADLSRSDVVRESDEIQRLQQQTARLRTEAKQTIAGQLDRLDSETKRQQQTIERKSIQLSQSMADHQTVLDQLASPDAHHCVTCGQGLSGTDHLTAVVAALERQKATIADQITRTHAEIEQLKAAIESIEIEMVTLAEQHETRQKGLLLQAESIETEIVSLREQETIRQAEVAQRADQLRNEIAVMQMELAAHYQQHDVLTETLNGHGSKPRSTWNSRDALWQVRQERDRLALQVEAERVKANPVQQTINGLTGSLHVLDYTTQHALTYELKHEQFLYKLLTSKESFIRKRLIDQSLPYLNRSFDRYLERLGLPHEARLLPDLTMEILLKGRDYDFEQLSRGEMNRVNMATSFSFRDLWQNLNQSVNLFAVDECLDQGNDSIGVETAVTVLQAMATEKDRNIFLISHREELKNQIDTVMYVAKADDFTEFVLEQE